MPSSSGSSSESSNSTTPTRRKRLVEDDHEASHASSAEEEEDWETDAPQPLPSTEVTALSHAERRRQKKKQKQLACASESPRKKRKLDDGTASHVDPQTDVKTTTVKAKGNAAADDPRRQKRQNSVWIGNMSFRTTQDALREFFDGVGTITRINMPMRPGKQENTGFAYVDFDTPDAKVIAITLSEGQLDGRNLLIKDGDSFTGRPAKTKAEPSEGAEGEKAVKGKGTGTAEGKGLSKTAQKILHLQKQPPAPTLFLGNLSFDTTVESIRELFEAHRYWGHKGKGKGAEKEESRDEREGRGGDDTTSKDVWIRKIRMGTFEDSGACKGFAFVDFTTIEHATATLVNPRNHRLNGRDLVVEYASPDAVRRGGGPRHPKGDWHQKSKNWSGKPPQKGSANAPRPWHTGREDAEVVKTPAEVPRSRQTGRAGHDRSHARRARPGAALAHAQRQSVSIIPSQGQKIVF